ncbi:hypothetical protein LX36DRAFT_277264 [Colletotrichum falcatum]|nr:hypothetical protein LX36DRAFT_277264 [Colletotrichum falcatum]
MRILAIRYPLPQRLGILSSLSPPRPPSPLPTIAGGHAVPRIYLWHWAYLSYAPKRLCAKSKPPHRRGLDAHNNNNNPLLFRPFLTCLSTFFLSLFSQPQASRHDPTRSIHSEPGDKPRRRRRRRRRQRQQQLTCLSNSHFAAQLDAQSLHRLCPLFLTLYRLPTVNGLRAHTHTHTLSLSLSLPPTASPHLLALAQATSAWLPSLGALFYPPKNRVPN